MPKMKIVEAQTQPLCPHCGRPLETIEKTQDGTIEQHTIYNCPHCKKVLGVGYNNYT